MKIILRNLKGQAVNYEVEGSDTVESFMAKIEDKEEIPFHK